MKLLVILTIAFVASVSAGLDEEFENFKVKFNQTYQDLDEEATRKQIFAINLKKIMEHNEKFANGETTFAMKVNQFSDKLLDETQRCFFNLNSTKPMNFHEYDPSAKLPTEVDWRKKHVVTDIKNQGQCGSCWAFSATGTLESMWAIKTGRLISLSEEFILDCSLFLAGLGCFGGNPKLALEFVKHIGIDTEEQYPYYAGDIGLSGICLYQIPAENVKIEKVMVIPHGDEKALESAVATRGPISVAINAMKSFQDYSHGVYDVDNCDPNRLNHGVLVVGYGKDAESGKDYWLVKNSWGKQWGDNGYIKVAKNKNLCGIAAQATYPEV